MGISLFRAVVGFGIILIAASGCKKSSSQLFSGNSGTPNGSVNEDGTLSGDIPGLASSMFAAEKLATGEASEVTKSLKQNQKKSKGRFCD